MQRTFRMSCRAHETDHPDACTIELDVSEAADAYDVCTRDAAGNFIDLLEGFDDGDNSVERHWLHARHTLIKPRSRCFRSLLARRFVRSFACG